MQPAIPALQGYVQRTKDCGNCGRIQQHISILALDCAYDCAHLHCQGGSNDRSLGHHADEFRPFELLSTKHDLAKRVVDNPLNPIMYVDVDA